MATTTSRILFIDAYDSFSNNIIALFESLLDVRVTKIYIDAELPHFPTFVSQFAGIICGPGPGHPGNAHETGLFRSVWRLAETDVVPVLGICLGFQSLVHEHGGSVSCLPQPRHGIETLISTSSTSIFDKLPSIRAIQYHSLYARLDHRESDNSCSWTSSDSCPDLLPLAWDLSGGYDNPEAILMAVRHNVKPFFGVQFHPESVCSSEDARQVVVNWWQLARLWLAKHQPSRLDSSRHRIASKSLSIDVPETNGICSTSQAHSWDTPRVLPKSVEKPHSNKPLLSTTQKLGRLDLAAICEAIRVESGEAVVLDSEMRQCATLGEQSIIGIIEPGTMKLKYSIGDGEVTLQRGNEETKVALDGYDGSVFNYIKALMAKHHSPLDWASDGRAFYGGFMGYITYEACLETIGITAAGCERRSDVCFAFVERSVVIDHRKGLIHIQSLLKEDSSDGNNWILKTADCLQRLNARLETEPRSKFVAAMARTPRPEILVPSEAEYKNKISHCQQHIRVGNSYELCLTDQTSIELRGQLGEIVTPWNRYLRLRRLNPAPFAAYIRLSSLTLLSTSPERFMCWSQYQANEPGASEKTKEMVSTCQFRPIKGTVKKQQLTSTGQVETVSLEQATALLNTQKEKAENLMIVDLIRHDLHGVAGSGNVNVKSLMAVEEYESVFQLVSVIEGKLLKPVSTDPSSPVKTGIDVLAASLPPGSMTGAPKRRSCQLLQEIEQHKPRSAYSGVLGYMCVSGKGDFSVVIRTIFKWDDGDGERGKEQWKIGAGGAITTLSTEEGEWEEMLAKLHSTLRLFTHTA